MSSVISICVRCFRVVRSSKDHIRAISQRNLPTPCPTNLAGLALPFVSFHYICTRTPTHFGNPWNKKKKKIIITVQKPNCTCCVVGRGVVVREEMSRVYYPPSQIAHSTNYYDHRQQRQQRSTRRQKTTWKSSSSAVASNEFHPLRHFLLSPSRESVILYWYNCQPWDPGITKSFPQRVSVISLTTLIPTFS